MVGDPDKVIERRGSTAERPGEEEDDATTGTSVWVATVESCGFKTFSSANVAESLSSARSGHDFVTSNAWVLFCNGIKISYSVTAHYRISRADHIQNYLHTYTQFSFAIAIIIFVPSNTFSANRKLFSLLQSACNSTN